MPPPQNPGGVYASLHMLPEISIGSKSIAARPCLRITRGTGLAFARAAGNTSAWLILPFCNAAQEKTMLQTRSALFHLFTKCLSLPFN